MMKKRTKNSSKNLRVKNATQNEYDGIKFRSKLETYMYKVLKENGINTEYETKRYTLLPSFKFEDKTIRPITYLPDFIGDGFIIECKGYPNDAWPLREKLMKYYLSNNEPDIKYYLVHTKKEIDTLVKTLKSNIL